jgi:UbiD family decarboxylase
MEEKNEIVHITEQVSPCFEVSSIIKAFDSGPITFFDNVEGHNTKIVANVSGSRLRICSSLNVDRKKLSQKIIESWRSPINPKIVKNGPGKEVNEKPKLSRIPVLTHFEKDAGAYITAAIISAKGPDGKIENVSIHRLLVLDDNHLAIRIVPRHLLHLLKIVAERNIDLEVAITLGLHPAVLLAAASPVPFGVSEFGVANKLLENKMRLIKCESVDAFGLADAEIILEGTISVEEKTLEGPLVDITGTYDTQRRQHVIEITNVMHREDYIYQALLPSGMEHRLLMGLPREVLIWETVSKVVPTVRAVNLSSGGFGWLHAIISIEKHTDGDGKNALTAAFAAHPSLKHAVVVDTDIDVYDLEEVEKAIATRFQADDDMIVIPHVRGSTLDPSADQETGLTTKLGIDATRSLTKPRERFEEAKIPTSRRSLKIIERTRKQIGIEGASD